MALRPEHYHQWIETNGPYLYHVTRAENIPSLLKHGLHPAVPASRTRPPTDDGWWTPRPNHVYMGTHDWTEERVNNDATYGSGSLARVRIDMRELDPERFKADEDYAYHEAPNPEWEQWDSEMPADPDEREAWADREPHDLVPNYWVWGHGGELSDPGATDIDDTLHEYAYPSLGETAEGPLKDDLDHEWNTYNSLDHEWNTYNSLMDFHRLAYEGVVPPHAISVEPAYMDLVRELPEPDDWGFPPQVHPQQMQMEARWKGLWRTQSVRFAP